MCIIGLEKYYAYLTLIYLLPFEINNSSSFQLINDHKNEDGSSASLLKNALSNENRDQAFTLVIPAYNEESRIIPFLKDIYENLPNDWEVIIVCDGMDRTAEICRSFGVRFNVLEFKNKLGKGGAILEGCSRAKGSVVGYADADGALLSDEIIKVFGQVDEYNPVAIASRWVGGSEIIQRQPIIRVILGRFYHYATFAILGLKQKDTQCGLKAFRRDAFDAVLNGVTLKTLSFDTAILYHCKLMNFKVLEVPVRWRDVGDSKVRPFITAMMMFAALIGLRLVHSSKTKKLRQIFSVLQETLSDI